MPRSMDPSEMLSTLNSMSLLLNPYPMILKAIEDQRTHYAYPHLADYALVLAIVHSILLIQASITLGLKIYFLIKNGQRDKIWIWRLHFTLDYERIPYLIPNNNFVIEPLQIMGCLFFELASIIVYLVVKYPIIRISFPGLHASCLFFFAVSFVPGFVGFWLSGWSAFYVLFFTPNQDTRGERRKTIFYHPRFMNTICIGMPILVSCFFSIIGVILTVKHLRIGSAFEELMTDLHQFTIDWKADNPTTFDNNQRLVNLMEYLLLQGSQILKLAQLMAIGWATLSILIIMFYLGTTISIGIVTKRTMAIATGRAKLFKDISSQDLLSRDKSKLHVGGSQDLSDLNAASTEESLATSAKHRHINRQSISTINIQRAKYIQRTLYFLRTSCGVMMIAMGFNLCTSLIFVHKARALLDDTQWQATLATLLMVTCLLISLSLLIQSLIHIPH
ncbi:hypothetical protein Pst134EA_013904 [Puccinia striiformis f. sp. tritici]|uniref:hypothetical protein n=1 Tax=Puccinia striiformis f. sp. tritici TaxID=168172 RepID=UPI0020083D89|nr:hypothetical protein Pst134EA_013904 [Puccinia striiformis f. sp. tritici]KAH9466057.1 hypothetical protein Pst134EA_013904 [Puccinia striiformis f. sp. tritici]